MKKTLYTLFFLLSFLGMHYGADAQCTVSVTPAYSSVCAGDSVTLIASSPTGGSFGNYQPQPVIGGTTIDIPIVVSGLPYNQLPAGALQSVCLNIACPVTGQVNLFLTSPNGTNIQLSTGNGGFTNSGYNNTCFNPLAGTNINYYVFGAIPANLDVRPEQVGGFSSFTGTQANGTWMLQIMIANGGATSQFDWVTLNFGDPYTYSWTPTTGLSCPTCPVTNATPAQTTTYTLHAAAGGCTATATATVNVVNAPCQFPVAVNDNAFTTMNNLVSGNVLDNDILPNPVNVTPVALVAPSHGSVTIAADGSFDYAPDSLFLGTDAFSYEILAANGVYDTAQVFVHVFSGLVYPNVTAICAGDSLEIFGYPGFSAYQWSTGETTSSIITSTQGSYYLTLTDALGATFTDSSQVVINPLPTALATSNSPLCNTNLAHLHGSGGVSYYWEAPDGTNSILQNPYFWNPAGPPATYCMTVTDANGCSAQSCTDVQSLLSSVSNDGPYCTGDTIHLHTSGYPGAIYSWHGPGGFNAIGQDVDIANAQPSQSGYYWVILGGACQSYYGTYVNVSDQQDLVASGYAHVARPSFNHYIGLYAGNYGCAPIDGSITLVYDSLLTGPYQIYPAPTQFDSINHIITWDFYNFAGFYGNQSHSIGAYLPGNTPIGTVLHHNVSISPIVGDADTTNNFDYFERVVSNSYDPNEITVSPAGLGPEGYITQADTSLIYTIHFQNTGNDTAFTVSLRDTLDLGVLDLESLEPLASSHPYQMMRDSANILIFYFDHILLPDSGANQDSSNGFVSYRIKLHQGLPIGTEIRNRAGIYFDYNEVVMTNTVLNTIGAPIGIHPPVQGLPLRIFPNPTSGTTILEFELATASKAKVELRDATGRLVRVLLDNSALPVGKNQIPIPTEGLAEGVYVVQVVTPQGIGAQKVLVKR